MTSSALVQAAQSLLPELQKIRRHLHQIPEFGLELPQTLAYVVEQVKDLGELRVEQDISCATVLIRGGKPGPTVLLRADMDALRVEEATGLEYASTNGYMHACGHDLHMALGIGAARLLHTRSAEMAGNVLMFFQSGEEGHGGADHMLERYMHLASGDLPVAAYGIHVFSGWGIPKGIFASKPGPLMASAGDALVSFQGKGGHGSSPWLSKDPISVMVEAIAAIPTMITKRFDAFDPVIVNVGWISAGKTDTTNVVPEQAKFGATIRTFSHENFDAIRRELKVLLEAHAHAAGLTVEVEYSPASQVVINDAAAVTRAEKIIAQEFGENRYVNLPHAMTGGEDFASIVKVIPGAFIFLGACPPEIDPNLAPVNHSNHAVFDDEVLVEGSVLLAALALDILR